MKIVLIPPFIRGKVPRQTSELVAFGRELHNLTGGVVEIWALGHDVAEAAQDMACYGLPVTAIRTPGISHYLNESFVAVLAEGMATHKPTFVCGIHTSEGWEWAPALAARIGGACICGVDGITLNQGRVGFQKEIYGGKVKGLWVSSAANTIVTAMPGVFAPKEPSETVKGAVTYREAAVRPEQTRYLGTRRAAADTNDITMAPIIVAVGNGIGNQGNITLAERLARRLPKAAVAGTRIVCDRGWLGYDRQIGISGATVAPDLYIACGISGASQHVMGMRGAGWVVAINTDPHAAIFNEADVCIVEDVARFLPLLEEACARRIETRKQEAGVG